VKCLDAEQSLDHSNGSCSGNRSIYWYLDPIRRSSPDAAEERGEAGCDHKVSPEEGNALREKFLKSELASRAGIVGVEFRKEDVGKWKSFVESRAVDIFFVAGYAFYSSPCRGGYLEAITNSEIISRASSIGAQMFRDDRDNICFLSVSRTIFGFAVNNDYLSRYLYQRLYSYSHEPL